MAYEHVTLLLHTIEKLVRLVIVNENNWKTNANPEKDILSSPD